MDRELTPVTLNYLPTLSGGLLIALGVLLLVYIVFTIVLYYHWQKYGTNAKVTWVTYTTYTITTVPLVLIMSIAAAAA